MRQLQSNKKNIEDVWVKVVLAISLDSRISLFQGCQKHLGGEGDRRILEESLSWADCTLTGGETLRVHQNTCLIHHKDLLESRTTARKSKQPISIIISNEKAYSLDWAFFKQPIERWLISSQKFENEAITPKGYSKQINIKNSWKETISELKENGLSRIIVLGGAKLVASLLKDDVIDELQFTIVPIIVGGNKTWFPVEEDCLSIDLEDKNYWILNKIEEIGKNELLLSYYRNNPRIN